MSDVDLVLAFLAGVVMGVVLDRWVLRPLVDAWIDRRAGMGDERGDDEAVAAPTLVRTPPSTTARSSRSPSVQQQEPTASIPSRGR